MKSSNKPDEIFEKYCEAPREIPKIEKLKFHLGNQNLKSEIHFKIQNFIFIFCWVGACGGPFFGVFVNFKLPEPGTRLTFCSSDSQLPSVNFAEQDMRTAMNYPKNGKISMYCNRL